jgi:VWFA-related protein
MRRNGQLISPLTVDKGIKCACRRNATIAALQVADVIKGGSLRLSRSSLSSSTLVFCLVLSLCAQNTVLQEAPQQSPAGPAFHPPRPTSVAAPIYDPEEGLIKVDVVVTDRAGKPISGIARKDFTLLDNGQPEKILTFHAYDGTSTRPDPPVKIILLVDALNLPERLAFYERREVERFLRQNNGHLAQPVSLVELSTTGIVMVGKPSADGNALAADFAHNRNLEWVRRVPSGMRGESIDSLPGEPPALSALKALGDIATAERQRPGRKLLIWVGPGWGVGSGAYLDSSRPRQDTFYTIYWFSTLLREARIALYSFSVGETNADGRAHTYRAYLNGVQSVQQATFMHLNRKVLAVETGGRVLEPSDDPAANTNDYSLTGFNTNSDLVQQINSCVQEADTYYTLSFDPSHANHTDEYHDLKVRINRPGLTARTTTGYYDEPYYSDQPNPAARPVTVEQLEQVLSAAHDKQDAEVARQLSDLTLTERLSSTRLLACLAGLRGGKARQALVALADASTFLNPPASEISTDAPPDHNAQQRMTSLALEYLNKTLPNLPNFYATRTTVHYQETPPFEKGDAKISYQPLHIADTVKDTVLYRNGNEVVESDTGKHKQRKADEPYLVTWGTFGPILRGAIDTIFVAPASLSWRRWEKGAGKSLAVFGYVMPEEKSSYRTGGCCLPDGDGTIAFRHRAGYHGEIAIDPTTGAILRLELIFDLKSTTPDIRSEVMIEYGPVEIAGKSYICPVRSLSIARGRSVAVLSETLNGREKTQWHETFRTYGPYATMLNDITFNSFHMFRADSHMLPGFNTAPEEKSPDPVSPQTPAAPPPQH